MPLNTQSIMFRDSLVGLIVNPFFLMRSYLYKEIKLQAPKFTGKILDLGCGSKPYAHLFANCDSYIGLDLEQSGHDHKNSNVDVYYDGRLFPFDDESFDAVVTFEVFEHIFDLEFTLKEIRRVLKPGGKLLITIPFSWPEHEQPFDFARYTSFGITSILKQCGFANLELRKTGHHFLVISQLFIEYCRQSFYPENKLGRAFLNALIGFPVSSLSLVASFIAPKKTDIYFNCVIVAIRDEDALS